MTDAAALVAALYQHFHRWQDVADACNKGTGMHHGPGYYQGIGDGQTKRPHRAALSAIYREARKLPASITVALKQRRTQEARKTVHLFPDDWEAGNLERLRLGLTWPVMVHLWRAGYEKEEA